MNYQDNISFSFEYPYLAIAVVIIVPAAIILMRRLKNPFMASIPLGPPGGLPFKAPVNFRGLIKILHFLEYLGIFALFLTAAFPIIKTSKTIWLNRGADILFVIDISPSMAAIDMGGQSRIDTAKKMMVNLMQSRPSDSIGLVAVGNDAAMLIPPTSDHQAVELRLEELQLGELGDGTALGMGLAIAAYHLDKSAAPKKITVLISDGENNAGAIHPHTAAEMLAGTGASLWVIGVGSGGEVPIDYTDPYTRIRRTGLFDSRYNTDALKDLAEAGEGNWIQAASADAFKSAFASLDEKELIVRRAGTVTQIRSCHEPFLLTAFSIIAFAVFIKKFFLRALA